MYLFLLTFMVYSITAIPVIYFEDNTELITTAYTLGLAHPPGYPLANSLGNLAGLLPFGNFALRCNLLSSFLGALAVYFFYNCCHLVLGNRKIAMLTALFFACSGNLWTQAVIFEVYTLYIAMFFFLLWVALSNRLNDFRWLLFSAFFFGLTVSVHLSASVTLLSLIILWTSKRGQWQYRMTTQRWLLLIGAGFFSWLIQFYLLARSFSPSDSGFFSWGKIDGLQSMLAYITCYINSEYDFNMAPLDDRLKIFSGYMISIMPWWCWLCISFPALLGLVAMARSHVNRCNALFLILLSLGLFSLVQYAAVDIILIIPWGITLLFIAFGINSLPERLREGASKAAIPFLILFFIIQFPKNNYSQDYSAYDYMVDVFDALPNNSSMNLSVGIQENYIFLYGLKGPPGIEKEKQGGQFHYFPYYVNPDTPLKAYGLLNTDNRTLSQEQLQGVWGYMRSFPVPQEFVEKKYSNLTRDMFKSRVMARIFIQRGYSAFQRDAMQEADLMFQKAADLNNQLLLQEAKMVFTSGDPVRAKKIVESSLERNPEPETVQLLGLMERHMSASKVHE